MDKERKTHLPWWCGVVWCGAVWCGLERVERVELRGVEWALWRVGSGGAG